MKIEINRPLKTLTFEVYGNFEDIVIVRQHLEKLPNLLVIGKLSKFMDIDNSIISVTCPSDWYNNVIEIIEDFITYEY